MNFLFVGHNTYLHCKKYIEGVILVSDEELINCMHQFYQRGLVVEPSGCAAMAALIGGHVPEDITGKKVVVFCHRRQYNSIRNYWIVKLDL